MTPQENDLVNALFDRLATLENTPRDPSAEQLIADGAKRAPHAIYALVQTALVQDEALKRANARIEALQAQTESAPEPQQQPASFLDTMREAFTGRAPARGSVPSVRPSAPTGNQPPPSSSMGLQSNQPQGNQPGYPPPGYPSGAPGGAGGSFLGTAASTAAGVIGGSLLLNGIRSMFGHQAGGVGPGAAFGQPWSDRAADSRNDLGRELGTDQVADQHDATQIADQSDYDQNEQQSDGDSVANPDDDYDADDQNDDGDYDDDGSDDDSYDV